MSIINEKFLKAFNSVEHEDRLYKLWLDSGFFNPDVLVEKGIVKSDAPTFSMVLPPPNVTGKLHAGHALTLSIEDTMVRVARMKGKRTLWIPGTDHAAIATQNVVEKDLYKREGKNRFDLGREEFLKLVNTFALNSQETILNQCKKMGASLDWSRLAFTLDGERNRAVKHAFKKMHDDGLIYRKNRVVNWDPKGQTTISDDEIIYEERKAKLFTFKYSKDFPIAISTTRPETKLGDTGIAVHPEDERYLKFIGQTFSVNFLGEELKIKIIADESIDKDFGTGAVGLTPAHSQVDYEMGERNSLEIKQVIDEKAKMMLGPEGIKGEKILIAREKIVELLKQQDLLIEEKEITANISLAERTGGVVEPLPKLQYFIAVNKEFMHFGKKTTLKELMIEAGKKIEFLPERMQNIYFNWINNLRDWCISRQIWYGHRIPVYYKEGEEKCVGNLDASDLHLLEIEGWKQDEDTLDTWFSSGLWTFSTLGWPEKTKDFETYHPTSVIETAPDIIFFWIARMILMSTYFLNEIPFKTIYFHGLVRDKDGKKISKSLGNNVDPIDLIAKYGADALRMAMIIGSAPGGDSRLSEEKCKAYKHFANKLWNATRFTLSYIEENKVDLEELENLESIKEDKIYQEWREILKDIDKEYEVHNYYLAAEKLYAYFWHTFADKIIEESKKTEDKSSRAKVLYQILQENLKALHPLMPFVTEAIWELLPIKNSKNTRLLLVQNWPI